MVRQGEMKNGREKVFVDNKGREWDNDLLEDLLAFADKSKKALEKVNFRLNYNTKEIKMWQKYQL